METSLFEAGRELLLDSPPPQPQQQQPPQQVAAALEEEEDEDEDKEELCCLLPPGFRFHPTDEEIILHYLRPKVADSDFVARAIGEADLNKCEPWDLPRKSKMGDKEWWFFCRRDRKYPTGMRTNRATESGYWKATGKDKEIFMGRGVELPKDRNLTGSCTSLDLKADSLSTTPPIHHHHHQLLGTPDDDDGGPFPPRLEAHGHGPPHEQVPAELETPAKEKLDDGAGSRQRPSFDEDPLDSGDHPAGLSKSCTLVLLLLPPLSSTSHYTLLVGVVVATPVMVEVGIWEVKEAVVRPAAVVAIFRQAVMAVVVVGHRAVQV
ncbi:unnamed protein product [Cuscuta campestris]|uniref:NAC domain-containing protein n=1 Tax=Cuscuta campestris TaxID=132261 RepID=A0A484KH65_9ASTE|nr:unnamed protein product [Cuscuta campestris]